MSSLTNIVNPSLLRTALFNLGTVISNDTIEPWIEVPGVVQYNSSYFIYIYVCVCVYIYIYIYMEIKPVHSEGYQPWDFFGRTDAAAETPVLWPPHAKS